MVSGDSAELVSSDTETPSGKGSQAAGFEIRGTGLDTNSAQVTWHE